MILGTRHFRKGGMIEAVAAHVTAFRSHHSCPIFVGAEIAQQRKSALAEERGQRFRQQVHSTLDAESAENYVTYPESLDFEHFNGADFDATLHAFFKNKYNDKSISVIVALGSATLKFVSSLRPELSPSAPIVFIIFDDAMADVPSNSTGAIALQLAVRGNLD